MRMAATVTNILILIFMVSLRLHSIYLAFHSHSDKNNFIVVLEKKNSTFSYLEGESYFPAAALPILLVNLHTHI